MSANTAVYGLVENYYLQTRVESIAAEHGVRAATTARPDGLLELLSAADEVQPLVIVDLNAKGYDVEQALRNIRKSLPGAVILATAPMIQAEMIRICKLAGVPYTLPLDKLEELLIRILEDNGPTSSESGAQHDEG